jgi:hypothetical protein
MASPRLETTAPKPSEINWQADGLQIAIKFKEGIPFLPHDFGVVLFFR